MRGEVGQLFDAFGDAGKAAGPFEAKVNGGGAARDEAGEGGDGKDALGGGGHP